MVRGTYRRGAFSCVDAWARAVVLIAACALAACAGVTGQPLLVGAAGGTTVAFESIDGPPETIFNKLVVQLNQEAGAHHISVVSRDQSAQYRIRGYIAAHTQGRRTTLTWVWDVYTADHQRAMRIGGEVTGTTREKNAWTAADDQAIDRIARDGMDRLATFLASPAAPGEAPASPPDDTSPNVAFAPTNPGALAYVPSRPE